MADENERRQKALVTYRRRLQEHKEFEAKVRTSMLLRYYYLY